MARPPIWRHLEPKPTRPAQRIMVPYEGFNECLRSLKGRRGELRGRGEGVCLGGDAVIIRPHIDSGDGRPLLPYQHRHGAKGAGGAGAWFTTPFTLTSNLHR